jgi:hypothetical protein
MKIIKLYALMLTVLPFAMPVARNSFFSRFGDHMSKECCFPRAQDMIGLLSGSQNP